MQFEKFSIADSRHQARITIDLARNAIGACEIEEAKKIFLETLKFELILFLRQAIFQNVASRGVLVISKVAAIGIVLAKL